MFAPAPAGDSVVRLITHAGEVRWQTKKTMTGGVLCLALSPPATRWTPCLSMYCSSNRAVGLAGGMPSCWPCRLVSIYSHVQGLHNCIRFGEAQHLAWSCSLTSLCHALGGGERCSPVAVGAGLSSPASFFYLPSMHLHRLPCFCGWEQNPSVECLSRASCGNAVSSWSRCLLAMMGLPAHCEVGGFMHAVTASMSQG